MLAPIRILYSYFPRIWFSDGESILNAVSATMTPRFPTAMPQTHGIGGLRRVAVALSVFGAVDISCLQLKPILTPQWTTGAEPQARRDSQSGDSERDEETDSEDEEGMFRRERPFVPRYVDTYPEVLEAFFEFESDRVLGLSRGGFSDRVELAAKGWLTTRNWDEIIEELRAAKARVAQAMGWVEGTWANWTPACCRKLFSVFSDIFCIGKRTREYRPLCCAAGTPQGPRLANDPLRGARTRLEAAPALTFSRRAGGIDGRAVLPLALLSLWDAAAHDAGRRDPGGSAWEGSGQFELLEALHLCREGLLHESREVEERLLSVMAPRDEEFRPSFDRVDQRFFHCLLFGSAGSGTED